MPSAARGSAETPECDLACTPFARLCACDGTTKPDLCCQFGLDPESMIRPPGSTMMKNLLILIAASALALMSSRAAENPPAPTPIDSVPAKTPGPPGGEMPKPGLPVALPATEDKLNILWTSQDREVALKMVFMYAQAAKKQGWWKEVHLIIWGPSARLTAQDKDVQDYLKRMQEAGVIVVACRACADQYGVSKTLEGLGVEVKYMGQPLTDILKRGEKLMTF